MDNNPSNDSSLELTGDGSHTVYSTQFDQHFHNPNGAIAESKYVFFEQTGLSEALAQNDPITILEIGFGTGLNLMLLMDYLRSLDADIQIDFYSVEAYPLSINTAAQLNYGDHLNNSAVAEKVKTVFNGLESGMNEIELSGNITLHLFNGLFTDFPQNPIGADYIFQDAFSPDTNPDLWTGEVFQKLKKISSEDVLLTTYCAASAVQGALAWADWKVAKTQGALGKREMILASPDEDQLEGLKRINEERYSQRYAEGDFN